MAECDCPLGRGDIFCKHIVATGLSWIEERSKGPSGDPTSRPPDISSDDINTWLLEQKRDDLVSIIISHAEEDDQFYDDLKMRAASGKGEINTTALRVVIRNAITIDDFVHYREAYAYSRGAERVVEQLRSLIEAGHSAQVLELIEYALVLSEEALHQIDDSDGYMSMIFQDLYELHKAACRAAQPDPRKLARKLFEWELNSDWDFFSGSYESYGKILGKTGQATFRELAEKAWSTLPRIAPGEDSAERYGRRGILTEMMQSFAEQDGDLDRLIDIMSHDLSSPSDFLAIAERCRKSRKYALAREWAEKALRAFPEHTPIRLRQFLAEEYMRAKRGDEAIELIWQNFIENPGLNNYEELLKYGRKEQQMASWREKALEWIRDDLKRSKAKSAGSRSRFSLARVNHSLLVEIFLWEKKQDQAWREAQTGGCSEVLWLRLAKLREKDHLADAVPIYQRQAEQEIDRKNNQAYQSAVRMIGHIRKLMIDMGNQDGFMRYLTDLKARHKKKRNFIGYLAMNEWGNSL